MILILLFAFLSIVGIILIAIAAIKYYSDVAYIIGVIICTLGLTCFITSILIVAHDHIFAEKIIYENNIVYESLCDRLNVINSDYEDVSKSDVIADVAEWNIYVHNTKYWTYNPWTNWYNPKEIADNLKYINMEGE